MTEQGGSLERKMEFLLEAQARASAQIEKLAEDHAILTRVMARLSERTTVNEDHLEAAITVVEHLAERFDRLTGRTEVIDERLDSISHKLEQLAEIQRRNEEASEKRFKALDERLNILVNVVEHHIAEPGHHHDR